MQKLKCEVTIFLTMLLALILLFLSALRASALVSIEKSYERGEANIAIESIFAEYHKVLFEEFHIFAIEASYETGSYSVDNLKTRLELYEGESIQWEVTKMQLLTDETGAAYEEQILIYMKQQYGISQLESLFGSSDEWESQRTEGEAVEEENSNLEEVLETQVEAINAEIAAEAENALESGTESADSIEEVVLESEYLDKLDFLSTTSVLNLVVSDVSQVSQASVDADVLVSGRQLETGTNSYALEDASFSQQIVGEYILIHFQNATDCLSQWDSATSETSTTSGANLSSENLQYEVEYILGGKNSDEENLTAVVNQLVLLRVGVNYTCLNQSVTKKGEVSALALSIATAAGYPILAQVLEQTLMIGWAYGESIMDVRSLLEGKHISLVKQEEDWQLSLSNLLNLEEAKEDSLTGIDIEDGLDYEDYLRILLYLEKKDNQLLRSLDMLEARMQKTYELDYFQADYCVTQLEYQNVSTISNTFTYEFPVEFTYR